MTNVRQIIINSPKYGQKIILVDEEDFELISQYNWHVTKMGGKKARNVYAIANRWWGNKNHPIYLHRFIMDAKKGEVIDHINGDTMDNRKSVNLRKCTMGENCRNSRLSLNNKSGYKGVYFKGNEKRRKKFSVQITLDRKIIRIGHYYTAIEAAKAYNDAALKYHGEFARLNQI